MKKYITLIAVLFAGLFANGLFAQERPTLNERIKETKDERRTLDWASPEIDVLADDIRAADPETINDVLAAALIQLGADADGRPQLSESSKLSSESEAWWRFAAQYGQRLATIIPVWIDEDLTQLPEDYHASVVYHWGVLKGPFTFSGVVDLIVGQGLAHHRYIADFKEYRASLPVSEQIALTETEKAGLIAVANRNARQDKWLTEVSADLMALKLDQ